MFKRLTSLRADRRGVTAVEYGLILAVIVVVMLVALHNFAGATITLWNEVAYEVTHA